MATKHESARQAAKPRIANGFWIDHATIDNVRSGEKRHIIAPLPDPGCDHLAEGEGSEGHPTDARFPRFSAHGHLDALHLSIWWKGVAIVVDPGTGAYHADKRTRTWLASREAHNGPCPVGLFEPQRLGPFLWRSRHPAPSVTRRDSWASGTLNLIGFQIRRTITHSPASLSWRVEDRCIRKDGRATPFGVRWQFAPGSWVKRVSERKFSVHRADVAVMIEVDENWAAVELVEPVVSGEQYFHTLAPSESLEGVVSPAFRKICRAPYLKLLARPQGDKPCVFSTTFLASAHS